jgi:hypothetical protein
MATDKEEWEKKLELIETAEREAVILFLTSSLEGGDRGLSGRDSRLAGELVGEGETVVFPLLGFRVYRAGYE